MGQSLGLAAYRALARRGTFDAAPSDVARPKGELVWIHAAEPGNMLAVQDLAIRLCALRIGLSVLITLPTADAHAAAPKPDARIFQQPVPGENPGAVKAFLDHWQPDSCIWVWGDLRPNLILETATRGCPLFLIDADTRGFDGRRDRWLKDLTQLLLSQFAFVLARSDAGVRRLVQLGLGRGKAEVTSPLVAGGQALPCADTDLTDLSAAIGGRPVWFATQLLAKEIPTILTAHRQAMRLSHRLLLILQPAAAPESAKALALSQKKGFATANWSDGMFPDDTTQVLSLIHI